MADKSKISWTDATINPIRARNKATGKVGWHCEHVSPACVNCYAEKQNAAGFAGGTRLAYKPGHREDIELFLDENTLTQPLRWKRPRKIFVCSMTDLFADFVPDEWIDRIFAVMALAPQHTFQVLTKRPKRMREYLSGEDRRVAWEIAADPTRDDALISRADYYRMAHRQQSVPTSRVYENVSVFSPWPLPNVWLGVTAEDQTRADERRVDLEALARQGWTTFCSYEPALAPVDWAGWEFLRQLIAGGESGTGARPSHPDSFRTARDWSASAGVAFYFKQWGEFREFDQGRQEIETVDYDTNIGGSYLNSAINPSWVTADGRHITDFQKLSATRPGARLIERVGKRRAGSLLDGVEHKQFPGEASNG